MYNNCVVTSFKHLRFIYLFSKIFQVFNEMEMEVNVIIDKIFTKFYLKIRVKGK